MQLFIDSTLSRGRLFLTINDRPFNYVSLLPSLILLLSFLFFSPHFCGFLFFLLSFLFFFFFLFLFSFFVFVFSEKRPFEWPMRRDFVTSSLRNVASPCASLFSFLASPSCFHFTLSIERVVMSMLKSLL